MGLQSLYEDGDAAFIANMGALVEPVTKAEFEAKTKALPPSLFAHNIMQHSMHTVHAQEKTAKGVLGRLMTALSKGPNAMSGGLYSLSGNVRMLDGSRTPTMIDRSNGILRYKFVAQKESDISNLTSPKSRSMFGETHVDLLNRTIVESEDLGALLQNTQTLGSFGSGDLSKQLKQVSRLLQVHSERGSDRDVFFTQMGGFDTHNDVSATLDAKLSDIDAGLADFSAELKRLNLWDNVTLVTVSDFGRTLTSNGLGTDHAWGGNYFVVGGDVRGRQILGDFPARLGDESDLNIGRGRLIPTLGWESMWNAVVKWFGLQDADLETVLPNVRNFPADKLLREDQLFDSSA